MSFELVKTQKIFKNKVQFTKFVWTRKKYQDVFYEKDETKFLRDKMTWDEVDLVIEAKTNQPILQELRRTKDLHEEQERQFLAAFSAVVIYYKKTDEIFKLVKSIYRSPVYFVRPLESDEKIDEMVSSNSEGIRQHSRHEESGWVMLCMSAFECKILSNVSLSKFVQLRDSIWVGSFGYELENDYFCKFPLAKKTLKKVICNLKLDNGNDKICDEPLHPKN